MTTEAPSVDLANWHYLHETFRLLPPEQREPGCVGLAGAFLRPPEPAGELYALVADRDLEWASLLLAPGWLRPKLRLGPARREDFFLLQGRFSTSRDSRPQLGPANVQFSRDFSAEPGTRGALAARQRRWLHLALVMQWSLLTAAIARRLAWQPWRDELWAAAFAKGGLGYVRLARWARKLFKREQRWPTDREKLSHCQVTGAGETQSCASALEVLPTPLLGMRPDDSSVLFAACRGKKGLGPSSLIEAWLRAIDRDGLVLRSPAEGKLIELTLLRDDVSTEKYQLTLRIGGGQVLRLFAGAGFVPLLQAGDKVWPGRVLGHDPLAPGLGRLALSHGNENDRFAAVLGCLGQSAVLASLRRWFDYQLLRLRPGYYHCPLEVCALAADRADPAALLWDINPALDHYDDGLDAVVLPPLTLHDPSELRWQAQHSGTVIDLTPPGA